MIWRPIRRRRCPHVHLHGIYGDAALRADARLWCGDCGARLEGPVKLAEWREHEAQKLAEWRRDMFAPEPTEREELSGYCRGCGDPASKHDGSFCAAHYSTDLDADPLGSGHSPSASGGNVADSGGSVEEPSTHLIHGSASTHESTDPSADHEDGSKA